MADNRLPSTQILNDGNFNNPELQVTQETQNDWSRIRLNNAHQGGFWDIACAPDNVTLNIFTSFTNGHNTISIVPHIVTVDGTFNVVNGAKQFIQDHPTDPEKEIAYVSLEGGEAGTYVRGTATLAGGEACIELPEHFALVTSDEGLTMHLTPVGGWLQVYVAELSTTRCVVREAEGRDGRFDYLVHGVRAGYEDHTPVRARTRRPEPALIG